MHYGGCAGLVYGPCWLAGSFINNPSVNRTWVLVPMGRRSSCCSAGLLLVIGAAIVLSCFTFNDVGVGACIR